MTGVRRVLVLAAVSFLSAAPAAAQSNDPNPFSQPRPELRPERGPARDEAHAPRAGRHHGRAAQRMHRDRTHRERSGEHRMHHHRLHRERLRQHHRPGRMLERLERQGYPRAGRMWERQGWRLERRGERLGRWREI